MDEEHGDNLVKAYTCIIKSLVTRSEDRESHSATSKFHSIKIPSITIGDYTNRILNYFQCSYECFVCSLAYIDLLLQNPDFVLNSYSIHRVILTTVMEAAKFYDDSFFNNELYARVGGVTVDELNCLEIEFVFLLNFSLMVYPEEYQKFHNELFRHCNEICTDCCLLRFPSLLLITSSFAPCYLQYSPVVFSDNPDGIVRRKPSCSKF